MYIDVFWSNFVYFVCLISVCVLISVCFHCLPETVNKDEYILIIKFNRNLRFIKVSYVRVQNAAQHIIGHFRDKTFSLAVMYFCKQMNNTFIKQ